MRELFGLLAGAALVVAATDAGAKERPTAVVEMAAPPPDFNTNVTALRSAAEDELRGALPKTRRLVISVALKQTATLPVACSVNATVRDARTGAMIAIIETASRAEGPLSPELRREMAVNAVRSAVRRVPSALK